MAEQFATCPACGRSIIIERGRFTVHTNLRLAEKRQPAPRCAMADEPLNPSGPSTFNQGWEFSGRLTALVNEFGPEDLSADEREAMARDLLGFAINWVKTHNRGART